VNAVVPQAELIAHCEKVANEILAKGPIAVRCAMDAAIQGLETDLEHGLRQESIYFGLLSATSDMRDGLKAFLEKRKPNFTGA
jgi:enoyl-CoA hydratase/carnithine racemase